MAALGITIVTLDVPQHPVELMACLCRCKPVDSLVWGTLESITQELRTDASEIRHGINLVRELGFDNYETLLSSNCPTKSLCVAKSGDVHNIFFTSGTTGKPRGALISQQAAAMRGLRLAQWLSLSEDNRFVGWLPFFHCSGDELLYVTF